VKDINDLTITAEMIKRLVNTPDPRLREILETLVTHRKFAIVADAPRIVHADS
jgi:hypothetical protein